MDYKEKSKALEKELKLYLKRIRELEKVIKAIEQEVAILNKLLEDRNEVF